MFIELGNCDSAIKSGGLILVQTIFHRTELAHVNGIDGGIIAHYHFRIRG